LSVGACPDADDVGDTFKILSLTAGSRPSICHPDQLDPLFAAIARHSRPEAP
jgi:hypothetical protein